MAESLATSCPHCGAFVEGPEGTYCCRGCELAARIISDAGLLAYYDKRTALPDRPVSAGEIDWSAVPCSTLSDGSQQVRLHVDGLRCASCVWVTERVLGATEGVQDAHVSYATQTATVTFDPSRTDLGAVAGRIAALGYPPRPAGAPSHDDHDLLLRTGVAAFGAANAMGLSAALYVGWFDGIDPAFANLFRWLALLVSTPVATWSAWPFFAGAVRGLQARIPAMDLPIAIAIAAMYAHGLYATVNHMDGYLDSMGMLVTLLLLGRVLEARGRRRALEAAQHLGAWLPQLAHRVQPDGSVVEVGVDALELGDRVRVRAGERFPCDGVVATGHGLVRMALLTGEAEPVKLGEGEPVVAGAELDDGELEVLATRTGAQTTLRRAALELAEAQSAPTPPSLADSLAPWFTGITLVVAGLTAAVLVALGHPDEALARAVAVLVVACPCALAISTPLVGAAALGALARRGVMVRSTAVLDALAGVDHAVLDKTGTLTLGRPRIVRASDEALRVAAALERDSHHPVASAVLDEAVRRRIAIPRATEVRELAGVGLEGTFEGKQWRVRSGGADRIVLEADDGTFRRLWLSDLPRPQAAADLAALRSLGLRLELLSGDHQANADALARELTIDRAHGGVSPSGKAEMVRALQASGARVMFVGDGLNDGQALVAAEVGVAMSTGATSSVLAADVVLRTVRLQSLVAAVRLARVVRRRIRLNLARSATYNVIAVIAAVAGWIDPLVAAVLMPLSSGLVIASAAAVEREAEAIGREVPVVEAPTSEPTVGPLTPEVT
jgi:Cu2+-exporting ATPase